MSASPLKLLSSMATRKVLTELADQYQASTQQAVHCEAAGGVDVAKRVQAGEAVDVVVLSSEAIDKLLAEGRLVRGSRVDLAKSGVAVAVRAGAPRPDIGSEEALKQTVLAATTISYSTGPSGVYLEKLFERWGILAAIRDRIVVPPPGLAVASVVARGSAELGFQQLSELLNQPGVEVVGPLPPSLQTLTIFSGAVATASDRQEAGRALLDYMASAGAASVKQSHGMEGA